MLYETLFHAKIFLSIVYFGLISGLFYEITHLLKLKNKIIVFVSDFVFMLIYSALYIVSVNIFCYGEFRFFTMPAFLLGFLIERKTIGKFVALFFYMIYNNVVKLFNKIKKLKIVVALKQKMSNIYLKVKTLILNKKKKKQK